MGFSVSTVSSDFGCNLVNLLAEPRFNPLQGLRKHPVALSNDSKLVVKAFRKTRFYPRQGLRKHLVAFSNDCKFGIKAFHHSNDVLLKLLRLPYK